ncbi:MAG: MBL fold metallo-hydrolase [bacterium]|nr:MBL fold metallo-hydrolase [bacterium]
MDRFHELATGEIDYSRPVALRTGEHSVYWVGSQEESAFRCNAYLLVDGDFRILIDPGSALHHFPQVRARVEQVVPPESISHVVVHHQDPDLCDSLPQWLEINPEITLVTTPRARVLLPYYGFSPDVRWLDVSPNDSTTLELPHTSLLFVTAPFLHFPEAFVTYDEAGRFLFSGDVGAAVEQDWQLVASDWERHWRSMVPFHIFYMASHRALKGFIDKIELFPLDALCPQHGSIMPGELAGKALAQLKELPCGIDLLYPASNIEAILAEVL